MKIQLTTGEDGVQGHLILAGETPAQAAERVAFYPHYTRDSEPVTDALSARFSDTTVIVATNDPMVFEIEPIDDAARMAVYDEDGEWESESYDLSRHPGALACSARS